MGTFEILLSMLIPIGVSIALFYIIKKQRKGIPEAMLNSSKKKKHATKPEVKDLVFASNEEREKYILEISKMHETNFIAWFENDLKYLNDLFGTDNPEVQNYLYTSLSAYEINPDTPMVLWGCHPLASIEKEVLAILPKVSLWVRLISLDDALMQHFGGDKIKSMIEKLGHKEGEILEHSMISASILNAQENIAKKVKNPVSAASAHEWFLLNTNHYD